MRSVVLTQANSIANNGSSTQNNVVTPDDNYPRILRNIFVIPQTAGLTVTVRQAGYLIRQIDASRCAAGNLPVEVNETWPATIPFSVDYSNTSGGSVTPTIICAYDRAG